MRSRKFPRAIARRHARGGPLSALAGAATLALAAACFDSGGPVGPDRLNAPPTSLRANSVTLNGTTLTATLPAGNSDTGSGTVTLGSYASPTLVEIEASGVMTVTAYWAPSSPISYDPGGPGS